MNLLLPLLVGASTPALADEVPDNYDIGVNTKSAQLVRFGLLAKNKSGQGTSVSSMRVGGKIEIS